MERDDENDSENVLAAMGRREFLLSVKRAEQDAADATQVRAVISLWATRLLPYLDRDPDMTVAEARERYRAEHPD